MRNLLHCRRGSVAFGVLAAMIPLIGAVALGTEAGSWYAIQRDAQNAADAAAMAGAYWILNSDAPTMSASATPFATKNGFKSSEVTISQPTSNQAKAVIVRSQPQLLTKLFYKAPAKGATPAGNVQIGATAIAQVFTLSKPCILALNGQISFQGSPNINAPNCGMASNDTANNALNFTGGGMSINVGSLSAAGGCTGTATFCGKTLTYQPQATNPFSALDSATLPTLSNCPKNVLTAYSAANACTNNGDKFTGNGNTPLSGGVYFISGTLTLTGGYTITGTALFILLPGASIDTKGGGTITITANASLTKSQLPPALQQYASDYTPSCTLTTTCLLNNMAIYDQDGTAITMGGNSNLNFSGNIYAPKAAVTFQGNPTVSACGELIAASIAFNGNATFDNSHCAANFKATTSISQYVALVQ